MSSNKNAKSAYPSRNNISGMGHKGLINQSETFDEIEAARINKTIGDIAKALDRYLATAIGSPAARAAMDALKIQNARAA